MKKLNILAAFVFATCALNSNAMSNDDSKSPKATPKPTEKCLVRKLADSCLEDCTKDTVKTLYKTFLLEPYVINPLKKIMFKESASEIAAEKSRKETASIIALATQINQLKKAGVDKNVIAHLSKNLSKKIQESSICPKSDCCKK